MTGNKQGWINYKGLNLYWEARISKELDEQRNKFYYVCEDLQVSDDLGNTIYVTDDIEEEVLFQYSNS